MSQAHRRLSCHGLRAVQYFDISGDHRDLYHPLRGLNHVLLCPFAAGMPSKHEVV